MLKLGIANFTWQDLHDPSGLGRLFDVFKSELKAANAVLYSQYENYLGGAQLSPVEESNLLVALGPVLARFIEKLFGVATESGVLKNGDVSLKSVFLFKRDFVTRRTLKKFPDAASVAGLDRVALLASVKKTIGNEATEENLAAFVVPILAHEKANPSATATNLDDVEKYVACLYHDGSARDWASFVIPQKIDFDNLVHLERPDAAMPEKMIGPSAHYRRRDGFKLTDRRMSHKMAMGEIDYCIYCHDREKDSCSKGLVDKKTGALQKNPLGIKLGGCPLDEKISEAHLLRKDGESIAALAMICVDNPMCPGTGHRICNDCMKSCIFQKQEPVNIPQAETNILTQVLSLPYGFEIYSLLTRFNPLNRKRPVALPYNGKKILVVGLGPAGYTLAHYLINEGFAVTGIDGLKIEPLPDRLTKYPFEPVKDITALTKELDERILAGFGGVAEYGITVRWDKNFLTMIYLNLVRRLKFSMFGGVRFGGTVTIDDAWKLGFDHIAMATGAGKPTIVPMKNNLIRGVRKASDFLMALQLTGAAKKDNMANLQIRLPAVVIGGGLTGVDTATEIMAYYPVQVEKFLKRYELLEKTYGAETVLKMASAEDLEILEEFIAHGKAVRAERERAKNAGEKPDFIKLVRSWGGVTLAYRKRLTDAPAYRLNHEEIIKAFEEGIYIVENMSPTECHRGKFGEVDGITFERQLVDENGKFKNSGEFVKMPARSVCVAAGTSPNTIYEKEYPGTFLMDEWKSFFAKHTVSESGDVSPAPKNEDAFFTSYTQAGNKISFYGDNHPDFAGNVVKAMASAQKGFPHVVKLFEKDLKTLSATEQPQREKNYTQHEANLGKNLSATVHSVTRLTPTIIEVVVKAPLAARNFQPGQFYRLQNYEADAREILGTKLSTEGVALTGAWTDKDKGLLSLIILEMGVSSRLCGALTPGQRVVVMGPTGTPTEIPKNETVLLAGGGLGNAVLFSIGQALKSAGNKVLYFAGYKNSADIFKQDEVERGTDVVIWSNDNGAPIHPRRPQDKTFTGNIVQAIKNYGDGTFGPTPIALDTVDRIVAIGSDRMMAAVKESRFTVLKPYLKEGHVAIGSINSTMQCMMKEVCAQCLQKHVDPKTGLEAKPVFSCFNQDQELDRVDFKNLNERLQANHLSEMISGMWLNYLFTVEKVERV